MRLAMSNIAWPAVADDQAAGRSCRPRGVSGVEIAPTKVWPEPLEAAPAEVTGCRTRLGTPRAADRLAPGPPVRQARTRPVRRPGRAGPGPGIPRRDDRPGRAARGRGAGLRLAEESARRRRAVGRRGRCDRHPVLPEPRRVRRAARGGCFCIEPNPTAYGCDYVTTAAEGLDLVSRVDQPGFGLHLDAGGMTLAGDPTDADVCNGRPSRTLSGTSTSASRSSPRSAPGASTTRASREPPKGSATTAGCRSR